MCNNNNNIGLFRVTISLCSLALYNHINNKYTFQNNKRIITYIKKLNKIITLKND